MDDSIMGVEIRHLNLFRERLSSVSREERFRKIAVMFLGATYKMGSENFTECDCSGLICSSLRGMGYNIRITANELIKSCCERIDPTVEMDKNDVHFMGLYDKKVGSYTHIGIVFHSPRKDTILHSSYPKGVAFEDRENLDRVYTNLGYVVDYYRMDFSKVEKIDGESYGLDEDFK